MQDLGIAIERAVLSSILFDPSRFEEISARLEGADFSYTPHRHIFEALGELHRLDLPLDEEFILTKETPERPIDREELLHILGTNPIANIEAYITLIKDRSIKRRLHKLANTIREYSQEENMESESILDHVESELYKISQEGDSQEFKNAKEVTEATLERIKELKALGNVSLIGVDTGFKELNKMTTGFGRGDLIIVAARPAMGKTTFVLNMAQKALDTGKGVAIFSLEMPAEQLMLRMLSAKTSIALQNLRVGNLQEEELTRLSQAAGVMASKPLFIDDGGNLTINQLRSKLRKLKSRHPEISLAIIDYLQLMSGSTGRDRHLEVSEISRGLKMLARELEIPIIALSQLNRSLESRSDRRPMLSDLRESGAIEQDADIILFVYREAVYKMKDEKEKEEQARREGREYRSTFVNKNEEEAEIIIGKQRNGPIGAIKLIFHKHCTRFVDADREVEVVFERVSGENFDQSEAKIEVPGI